MKNKMIALQMPLLTALALPAFAQTDGEIWVTEGSGNFFLCVIAGILLAFAFQFLLTNLAVAVGITAIGDLEETDNDTESSSPSNDRGHSTPMGVKVSSGFGLFLTITMSISLFLASLFAVKLSLIPHDLVGYTLGLVIWAGYLLLGLYLDSKMVSSLLGSVFSSIKGVLGAGATAITDALSPGKSGQIKHAAEETVKAIHDEIRQEYDLSGIQDKLDDYIHKLEPKGFDLEQIKDSLSELLHEIEIKEKYTPDDPDATKRLFLEVASKQPSFSAKDKEKLMHAFDEAKEIYQREGSRSEKAMAMVDKITPGDEEEGKKYRQKMEQFLRDTKAEELDPDRLKEDFDKILNNPKAAAEVIRARASSMDRSTIKSILTAKQGISEEKAEQYLRKAEEFLDTIRSKTGDVSDKLGGSGDSSSSFGTGSTQQNTAGAERSISNWFNRMNRPELRYDRLKFDARRIIDDPKSAPGILKRRLEQMDRDSVIALVSNNDKLSKEQAEKVADKIEEARSEVLNKIDEIERKVKEKAQEAKEIALHEVENARKTAASLAWWIFISAIVSGVASALGGMAALSF